MKLRFAALILMSTAAASTDAWAKSLPATAVYPPTDSSACWYNYQQVPANLVSTCCENGMPKGGNIAGCPPQDNPSGSLDQIYNGGAGQIISGGQSDLSDAGKMVSDTPVIQGSGLADQSASLGGANLPGTSLTSSTGLGGPTTPAAGTGNGTGSAGATSGGNSGDGSGSGGYVTTGAAPSPSPGIADKLIGDILSTVDSFVKGQSSASGGAGTESGSAAGGVTVAGGGSSEEDRGTASTDVKHSDDPENYFSLTKADDNLFKIVTRRYVSKTKEWVLAENAALMPKSQSLRK